MVSFAYTIADSPLGQIDVLPLVPMTLINDSKRISATGLIDTGSPINVLPFGLGIEIGAVWEQQSIPLKLTGNLAAYEARVLILNTAIGEFGPTRLAFAWTKTEAVPLLLGQVNFFAEFDVCFYRSRSLFEVTPKS